MTHAQKIVIRFDGGCRPTNPGNKYGSFEVSLNGRQIALMSRFELGHGTNNEAEFEAFEAALKWTRKNLVEACLNPIMFDLEAFSDSMVVVNRISGSVRSGKSPVQKRMNLYCSKCLNYTKLFNSFSIRWNGRAANVKTFGH